MIKRDKAHGTGVEERTDQEAFEEMAAILRGAFAAADCEYELLSSEDIKRRAFTRLTTR
ncbi:MAG: hypothetical protein Q8Q62_05465 [Mesorhizobium sp.]|nr:hypothetical protein [Mesorhizobium sp.]